LLNEPTVSDGYRFAPRSCVALPKRCVYVITTNSGRYYTGSRRTSALDCVRTMPESADTRRM